jgi:hypothetical protein
MMEELIWKICSSQQVPKQHAHFIYSRLESYDKILMFTDGLSTLSGDLPTQVPKSPGFSIYLFFPNYPSVHNRKCSQE